MNSVTLPFTGIYRILLLLLFICAAAVAGAQMPANQNHKQPVQGPAVLTDTNLVSSADYLEAFQQVYEALNRVPAITGSFSHIPEIGTALTGNDSAISLLKQRLSFNTRTFNLQNLHMFRALLNELSENEEDYKQTIATYDTALISIKKQLLALRKDSLIRKVFRTAALRDSFATQITDIRKKWKVADSLLSQNTAAISSMKAHIAANELAIQELLYQTGVQLKSVGARAFLKDRDYIWQSGTKKTIKRNAANRAQLLNNEKQIAGYYFRYTRSDRLTLLFISLVFFLWVAYSYRSLARVGKLATLDELPLRLLSARPWWLSLILLLTLIPAFELQAPAIYIELVQTLLALCLSKLFYKKIPDQAFKFWLCFVILLLTVPLSRIIFATFSMQRWFILLASSCSIGLGSIAFRRYRTYYRNYRLCYIALALFVMLNAAAVIANILGRGTLTQLFYTTAPYTLLHAVGLTVIANGLREAFLVHIKNCRVQKGYSDHFEWEDISRDIAKVLSLIALVLWLALLATNLDLFNSITDSLAAFLSKPRKLGGFSITFGGLLLCVGIIWLANFLQKYIAYFFGETGEDAIEHANAQHSRLLITRLILLITGFFLAVAASGLPIDKITVIIGALSVGIGLGLQSIVNNFISGIILIFDRTIRVGDVVELSNRKGKVKEIGIRTSTLVSDDGADIIIPNGDILSHNIINWTLSNNIIRSSISIIISKPLDAETLSGAVKEVLLANENVSHRKMPAIYLSPISAKWSVLKIFFWSDLSNASTTKNVLTDAVYAKLKELEIATPE
ncbi:mechanosensitive ion channel family protein [Niabella ginsenosidivorans]|nr:mechanosensitive ion channel domain-containing protein [Niabella ginsenosidivorans]